MEIKKNYELHKFGNKIVLLGSGLCPSPTGGSEWKTKVLLEADELIAHSEVRLSANDTFFIMRVGENFAICRDIDGQMYVSPLFK